MATCPACDHDVTAPFFLNLDAWRHLVCPHCQVGLEMKPRPVGFLFFPVVAIASWLGRLGHIYSTIAEVLVVSAMVTIVTLLIVRPQLRLRNKPLPKPSIRLNIDGPSN